MVGPVVIVAVEDVGVIVEKPDTVLFVLSELVRILGAEECCLTS